MSFVTKLRTRVGLFSNFNLRFVYPNSPWFPQKVAYNVKLNAKSTPPLVLEENESGVTFGEIWCQ
jgi:hypothetical protein